MDHSAMGHDMSSMEMDRCTMNVCSPLTYPQSKLKLTTIYLADALHLGHKESLPHLPLVARSRHSLPDNLPPRRRRPDCPLRSCPLWHTSI